MLTFASKSRLRHFSRSLQCFAFLEREKWRGHGLRYLISKDPNGACRRDLVCREPRGCQLRRDAQDEDLRDGDHRLPGEQQEVLLATRRGHFDPTAEASAQRTQNHGQTEALKKQMNYLNKDVT